MSGAVLVKVALRFFYTLPALRFGNRNHFAILTNKLHPAVDRVQILAQLIAVLHMFGRWLIFQLLLPIKFTVRFIFRADDLLHPALVINTGIDVLFADLPRNILGIGFGLLIAVVDFAIFINPAVDLGTSGQGKQVQAAE